MIVKNENAVICRCLASVKPFIDYWVIVDTGSTDGTQGIIQEFMKDIPGELHARPWVNFAHNRNEALELAKDKADYILIIDADEILIPSPGFVFPQLDKDFYFILTEFKGIQYGRNQLVNARLHWEWHGVLHEVLVSTEDKTRGTLRGIINVPFTDGARSQDPQKYYKDAQVLEAALKDEPDNRRYQFYLAQSYFACGEYERALEHYEKRVAQGGNEEVFFSLLQIARLQETLKKTPNAIIEGYWKAYHACPWRAEPLWYLANYYRRNENYQEGYRTALQGLSIPIPSEYLFVEPKIYEYDLLLEFSICAYWLGHYVEAKLASQLLLTKQNFPNDLRNCVQNNSDYCTSKLFQKKKVT